VLFDEVEKAHPDVFNVFLQVQYVYDLYVCVVGKCLIACMYGVATVSRID